MKKLAGLLVKIILVAVAVSAVFAASADDEVTIPDPTILGISAGKTDAGSFTAEEKAPENLRASADELTVNLTWDEYEQEGFSYNVYRATSEKGNFVVINKAPLKNNFFTDSAETSLVPPEHNTIYFYRVTATDGKDETGDSNMAQAKPMGKLMPPAGINTFARDNSIVIKWAKPVSSGDNVISAYNIFRGTQDSGGPQITRTAGTATEFTDNADGAGLTIGVKYYYWMQSVDSKGLISPLSKPVFAAPFSGISSPRNVTISAASSESIKILWDEPESQGTYGILGYRIYRSTEQAVFPKTPVNERLVKPYLDSAGRLFYYDNIINSETPPEPGQQYYYRVVPVDTAGNTGSTNEPVTGNIEYLKIERNGLLSADISEYGLPPDSKLKLTGIKSIKIQVDTKIWGEKLEERDTTSTTFKIEQPLRLDLSGNIGSKIFVDIKYDDSELAMASAEDKKISIRYQGDKDETLQELSFGDINFDLPSVRYVRPLASLFGIKGKASFLDDKLKLSGAWAQTKGITDIQEFTGTMRDMQTNGSPGITIIDTNFIANTYYYLTKDVSKVTGLNPLNSGAEISVESGSVLVYLDDMSITTDNLNTVITAGGNYHFDKKDIGSDYTVDYKNGVIKFNFGIAATNVVAVAYRLTNGESVGYTSDGKFDFNEAGLISAGDGFTLNSAHLIKSTGTDISHMVMNYYYMGAAQINSPNTDSMFEMKVYDNSNVDQGVPRPWEPNADRFYEIDANFGIIKFKNFYPFIKNSAIIYTGPSSITGNESDCYNVNRASAVSNYKMFFKFRYNISSYRLDNSPVVANSERVFKNNRLLKKDADYQILYETGDIVFINKSEINETDVIKIVYEYSPFIQTFESTVLGARLDYDILENLKLGATYIRKDSTKGTEPPDARSTELTLSTPYSGYVADANISFNLKKENLNYIISSLPFMGKTDLPVDFRFDAEAAYSDLNANTFDWKDEKGIAMIDNMEGADNERSTIMRKTAWFPSALPTGKLPADRAFISRDSEEAQGHEKTQSYSDGYTPSTVTILKLTYNGLNQHRWDSIRQNISVAGENLHNYSYLEMWVRVKTNKPVKLDVDIGIVSEDSNGNNSFKYNILTPKTLNDSEDTIITGQLKPSGVLEDGEDIGISPGIYSGMTGSTPEYWGAKDGIVNSEDLNNNGMLDTGEKYYRYSASAAINCISHPELKFSSADEWVNVRIPLNQISDSTGLNADERNTVNTQFLSLIKHVRLTLSGLDDNDVSGTMEIESIKFVGNSWMLTVPTPGIQDGAGNYINSPDISKFDAYTVKKDTESSYTPNLNFFEWSTEADKNFEESLKIKYNLSSYDQYDGNKPIYYVRKPFGASIGYDYRPYKYLKVDVFYKTKDASAALLPGRIMFIRLGQNGADENQNYYQYNEQLTDIIPGVWQTVVFRIDGSDKKRTEPSDTSNLRQVNVITVGFINPNTQAASEEFYINNIRLTDPEPKQGMAKYMSSVLNVEGVGVLTHMYEDKDTDFNSIEDITKSQMRRHSSISTVRFNPVFVPFLSNFTNAYSRTQDFIEDKYKDDLSYTANQSVPDTDIESYESIFNLNQIAGFSMGNNMRYIRQKDIYYGDKKDQSNKTDRFIWQPSASWTAPREFFIIPLGSNRFDGNLELNNYDTQYLGALSSTYYPNWKLTIKQKYRWEGGYDIWKFNITPVCEYMQEEGKGNMVGYNYYDTQLDPLYHYSREYLMLKKDILPSLAIKINDAWIFSPALTYSTTYRLDYAMNQLNTTGRLEASTGLALSQLFGFLPNISRYSFAIDLNEMYDNRVDTHAFEKFDALTFERKWNVTLWKMLYDDNEMKMLENISQYGSINISHALNFDTINFGEFVSFNPRGTYTKYRSSSGKTLQDPNESWNLDMGNIQVKKITIPFLEFLVKEKTMSVGYSFRKDITREAADMEKIIKDSGTHRGSVTLLYGAEGGGLGGNVGFSIEQTNSRTRNVTDTSQVMTPSFALNYILRKEDPFTVWDWVPGIGGKVLKFDQNLNLTLSSSMTFRNSETSGAKIDTSTFLTTLSGNYNVLQNLKANAAISYTNAQDHENKNNNYQLISVSIGGDLEF